MAAAAQLRGRLRRRGGSLDGHWRALFAIFSSTAWERGRSFCLSCPLLSSARLSIVGLCERWPCVRQRERERRPCARIYWVACVWLQMAAIEHLPRSHEAQEHMRRRVNEMKEESETAEALHRRRRMQSADGPVVEHTLALLKPDFVKKGDMSIARLLSRLRYDGFAIVRQKKLEPVLKRDLAHELYKEHENRSFFPKLMDYMASGPAFAIELQAVDAVRKWRNMIGPTDPAVAKVEAPESLRAKHVRVCRRSPHVEKGAGLTAVRVRAGQRQDIQRLPWVRICGCSAS